MLFRAFPNLEWLKRQAKTRFSDRKAADGSTLLHAGWPNVVMNATATRAYRDNIPGPLSIFTNISGTSRVETSGKRVALGPDTFYIPNTGQAYTLDIESLTPVETLNIHFGEHFAEEALGSLHASPEASLENETITTAADFHNRVLPSSPEFIAALHNLKQNGHDKMIEDENLV